MQRWLGGVILRLAPKLMKTLSIVGTAAMFLVGGGILVHSIPLLTHWLHAVEALGASIEIAPTLFRLLAAVIFNGFVGVAVGGVLVGLHSLVQRFRPQKAA